MGSRRCRHLIRDEEEQHVGFGCDLGPIRREAEAVLFGFAGIRILVVGNDDARSRAKIFGFDRVALGLG